MIKPLALSIGVLFLCSCNSGSQILDESEDPAFDRARAYLKVGKNEEALDDFLLVTRRVVECPKSHLEAGRLLLTIESRKDPVAAIYHFRRYLLLAPDSRESSKVEQLIVTAEREIIRNLPGEPYANHLDTLGLKEENLKLRREIADLKARLGIPLTARKPIQSSNAQPSVKATTPQSTPPPTPPPPTVTSYEVQPGDSLYAISRKIFGDSSHIDRIFQANRDVLASKNSLRVGQKLKIPPAPAR